MRFRAAFLFYLDCTRFLLELCFCLIQGDLVLQVVFLQSHFKRAFNVEIATNGPTYGWFLLKHPHFLTHTNTYSSQQKYSDLFHFVHLKRYKRLFINIVTIRHFCIVVRFVAFTDEMWTFSAIGTMLVCNICVVSLFETSKTPWSAKIFTLQWAVAFLSVWAKMGLWIHLKCYEIGTW